MAIDRRTLLKGIGGTLALPLLEAHAAEQTQTSRDFSSWEIPSGRTRSISFPRTSGRTSQSLPH